MVSVSVVIYNRGEAEQAASEKLQDFRPLPSYDLVQIWFRFVIDLKYADLIDVGRFPVPRSDPEESRNGSAIVNTDIELETTSSQTNKSYVSIEP